MPFFKTDKILSQKYIHPLKTMEPIELKSNHKNGIQLKTIIKIKHENKELLLAIIKFYQSSYQFTMFCEAKVKMKLTKSNVTAHTFAFHMTSKQNDCNVIFG